MDDNRSDIWFFDHSKEEIEELVYPMIDPKKIIGKVIGKTMEGKLAQYYMRCTDKECHMVFTCLLLANVPWFKVRNKLYYARKSEMSVNTTGIISSMHFQETTWDECMMKRNT